MNKHTRPPESMSATTGCTPPPDTDRRRALQWSLVTLAAVCAPALHAQATSAPAPTAAATAHPPAPTEEVPYVQTPPLVVRRMLQLAEVTSRDVLWDLGSGDGRIVIAAARDFGARGVGYEIDPALIRESRARSRTAGVAARTRFLERDLFTLSFAEPSVVTLYLLPEFNAKLRPLLLAQMRPGSRVVSHEWDMGDWTPDETLLFRSPEKPHGLAKEHKVMLWVIPAAVAGRWQVSAQPGGTTQRFEVTVAQTLQVVSASASSGRVLWANLRGRQLSIAWQEGAARWLLRGDVDGAQWRGSVQTISQWSNTTDDIAGRFTASRL